MNDAIHGSCLCGEVRFRLDGDVINTANCHCSICRRTTGAAFNTVVLVRESEFRMAAGSDRLRTYQLTERAVRHFCQVCGTAVYNTNEKFPGLVLVPLGAFDDPGRFVPTLNVYCESMLPWVSEVGGLRSFPQGVTR